MNWFKWGGKTTPSQKTTISNNHLQDASHIKTLIEREQGARLEAVKNGDKELAIYVNKNIKELNNELRIAQAVNSGQYVDGSGHVWSSQQDMNNAFYGGE